MWMEIQKDKDVKKTLKAMEEVRAKLDEIEAAIEADEAKVASIRAEIERVEAKGDLSADIVGLYRDLEKAEDALDKSIKRSRPVRSAYRTMERALGAAERQVVLAYIEQLRKRARKNEKAIDNAVQTMLNAAAEIEEIERTHGAALQVFKQANSKAGDRVPSNTDLGTLHRRDRENITKFAQSVRDSLRWTFYRPAA